MYRVIVTTWQDGEDENGTYRSGTDQTIASGVSQSEADRIASEWSEAWAGSDVSVTVEPE